MRQPSRDVGIGIGAVCSLACLLGMPAPIVLAFGVTLTALMVVGIMCGEGR